MHMTKAVKALIIVNVAVFAAIHLLGRFSWVYFLGLVPKYVFSRLMLWQFFTYMFVHLGMWHLVINMLMLWFFGPAIEAAWGRKQFLFYYFFTGIGAGFFSFLTSFSSAIAVVGASGAIYGILVAYTIMFPETIILLFFIFPMKIKYAVFILAGINLLGAISSSPGGIAYTAHLGGGLLGYLYLKSEGIKLRLARLGLTNLRFWLSRLRENRRHKEEKYFDKEVDRILDKISKHGMHSLSRRERSLLKRRSQEGRF